MEAVSSVIKNVLTALYETSGFAIVLAVLFMFFVLYSKTNGVKQSVRNWVAEFKNSAKFRWVFALTFYVAMILFRTLLNRNLWVNPLSNVLGGWTLHTAEGKFTSEPIENIMLFIPFAVLVLGAFKEKLLKNQGFLEAVWQSTKIVFLFSLSIEVLQMFLQLGTMQLSDLVYNTVGGALGGAIYRCVAKLKIGRRTSGDNDSN